MTDEIKKLKFKRNVDLQVEVVPLHTLINITKNHLTTPHRTNLYHIFLFEDCQPTHFVDFEPVKIESYSLLFIDKDRVHQFDKLLKYKGRILIFTDDFFCTTESDIKFLRSSILFNDLSGNATIQLTKDGFKKFVDNFSFPDKTQHFPFCRQGFLFSRGYHFFSVTADFLSAYFGCLNSFIFQQ